MKTYMKSPKKQVVEADVINVPYDTSEENKKNYIDKIRNMGILRKESEMPKRAAVGQLEESIKKSGRHGFEPVSSPEASKLYQKSLKKGSVGSELEKEFKGLSPEEFNKKEESLLEDLQQSKDPKSKKYLDKLRTQMRTA